MGASDEADHLLIAARKDLRAPQGMFVSDAFADEIFGFRSQQAAEKALRAQLTPHDVEYPRAHCLCLLLALLGNRDQDISSYLELIELNPYASQYRYEVFDDLGSPIDRNETTQLV